MSFQPLKTGDLIGVCAPSSYVERGDINAAVKVAEDMGYQAYIHPQTFERDGQIAGTTAKKIAALHDLYTDTNIKAIWAAGGGNRALDLLDALDYDLIRANPKPLIGFSDITALLNAIYARTEQSGLHAPVFKQLGNADSSQLKAVLSGGECRMEMSGAKALNQGTANGALIGGNLSLFHLLCGTNDCPPVDGAILCLEDCGDHISRFDRMFIHMKRHGVFDKISGLVVGEFSDLQDGARPFGFSLEDIIAAHCPHDIPIIMNAPFGHGTHNAPFPIGVTARLHATDDIQLNW